VSPFAFASLLDPFSSEIGLSSPYMTLLVLHEGRQAKEGSYLCRCQGIGHARPYI
jgi:hypothetical protein